jgi:hypothetical protein
MVQIDTQQLPVHTAVRVARARRNQMPRWHGMSGHQIFVDALLRRAPRLTALTRTLAMPLRIGVRGRSGVGRDAVAVALALAGFTVSDSGQDVDVYVTAEVLKPEDCEALAAAGRPAVLVLNKADLAGFGPGGPLVTARRLAQRLGELTGVPTRPLVAVLAVAALDGTVVDDMLMASLRVLVEHPADLRSPDAFVAASHRLGRAERGRLIEALDLFGIAHAVVALRRDPDAGADVVRPVLREVSGIDDITHAIELAGAEVRYRQVVAACDDLAVLAVHDTSIAELLAHDDTVVARMAAAVDVVEAAGLGVDPTDEPAAHLDRAVKWRHYAAGPVSALHRSCGTDIMRGSLRLLEPAAAEAEA